ncbi:hypothetical protein CTEN210_04202 [Chaetoceros tenuissimus]|uniref:Exostosin GT47 domain-containing protein n=1 Tax=Chaetoceros tenuissimus TaxID=426638 RepID=A0AAD3CKF7_9STRA|nr:hypothetical protein CTEN210_04202 [Chaetoceros tenuissimus]
MKNLRKEMKHLRERINSTAKPTERQKGQRHGRLINDVTLPFNTTIYRTWLEEENDSSNVVKSMLLLTNYGWNKEDQIAALRYPRMLRERELYSGIVNHPLFHPTGWDDIEKNGIQAIRNNTNYYVFFDRMNCKESNYPKYGQGLENNTDRYFGRASYSMSHLWNNCVECAPPKSGIHLEYTTLFQAAKEKSNNLNINVTLMLFDCAGFGNCIDGNKGKKNPNISTSITFLSGDLNKIDQQIDQGLIPPANKQAMLTPEEEESIRSCNSEKMRDFNVVYMGNFRNGRNTEFHNTYGGARMSYRDYHNIKKGFFIQHTDASKPKDPRSNNTKETLSFVQVLKRSKIALAPRGDNKFSYRFTEVLSAGAIPVYHGDNYVLPFRPELIDWSKCAIIFPEKDSGNVTMTYIEQNLLPDSERICRMRNYCYFEIYKKYIETNVGIIDGLVKGLDLVAKGHVSTFRGHQCNHTIDSGCNNI